MTTIILRKRLLSYFADVFIQKKKITTMKLINGFNSIFEWVDYLVTQFLKNIK
jgi:hypothetical protein